MLAAVTSPNPVVDTMSMAQYIDTSNGYRYRVPFSATSTVVSLLTQLVSEQELEKKSPIVCSFEPKTGDLLLVAGLQIKKSCHEVHNENKVQHIFDAPDNRDINSETSAQSTHY